MASTFQSDIERSNTSLPSRDIVDSYGELAESSTSTMSYDSAPIGGSDATPNIPTFPIVDYSVPAAQVVPNSLIGKALIDTFLGLYHNEKKWLNHLLELRFRILDKMDDLIDNGMPRFTSRGPEAPMQFPNPAAISNFHLYQEIMEEMAFNHTRIRALCIVMSRIRRAFRDKKHLEGLEDYNTAKMEALERGVVECECDVDRILNWMDPRSIAQPHEMIHYDNRRTSPRVMVEEARLVAKNVAYRLQRW